MNAPAFRRLDILCAGAWACLSIGCSPQSRRADGPGEPFVRECAAMDTLTGFTFSLSGFAPGEIDTIRIAEYRGKVLADSFAIPIRANPASSDPGRTFATIGKTLSLKNRYRIYIPGEPPHELTDMKRIVWPRFAGGQEGWGCVMGDFTFDGMRHGREANVDIGKE